MNTQNFDLYCINAKGQLAIYNNEYEEEEEVSLSDTESEEKIEKELERDNAITIILRILFGFLPFLVIGGGFLIYKKRSS